MSEIIKIVADSSADLFKLNSIAFNQAPLKICRKDKEYIDNEDLDVEGMVSELLDYQGKVTTACPAPGEWLDAFGDSKYVIAFAISAKMSGSYNSLVKAKDLYEEEYPDRHVFAINSVNAGPGIQMLIYKTEELINKGMDFDSICKEIDSYRSKVGLLFNLQSLHNFANNGRVNPLIAKAVGLLGINIIGERGEEGTLDIIEKKRGVKKAMQGIVKLLPKKGYKGGRIIIGHVLDEELALSYKENILSEYPDADVSVYQMHGLCSFYAEKGGLLVAFERELD